MDQCRGLFLVYLYLNISNTILIDSETFNVKVHSPWGDDIPYKGPLYIVDLTSVILIHLQKMRYILENILFFSFENLKGRHNLVQEMHLITFFIRFKLTPSIKSLRNNISKIKHRQSRCLTCDVWPTWGRDVLPLIQAVLVWNVVELLTLQLMKAQGILRTFLKTTK